MHKYEDIMNEKDDVVKHTMVAQAIGKLMDGLLPDTEFAFIMAQNDGIGITSSCTEPMEIMGLIGVAFKMLMQARDEGDDRCRSFTDPKEAANFVAQIKAEHEAKRAGGKDAE